MKVSPTRRPYDNQAVVIRRDDRIKRKGIVSTLRFTKTFRSDPRGDDMNIKLPPQAMRPE